jgi:heme/copper-type cytochrome/quinol oxidase subunit 2
MSRLTSSLLATPELELLLLLLLLLLLELFHVALLLSVMGSSAEQHWKIIIDTMSIITFIIFFIIVDVFNCFFIQVSHSLNFRS